MKHYFTLAVLLVLLVSCDPNYNADKGSVFLSESDRSFVPYEMGDTVRLFSDSDSVVLVVERVVDTMEYDNEAAPSRIRSAQPPYQDIQYRYVLFADESVLFALYPEESAFSARAEFQFRQSHFTLWKGLVSDTALDLDGRSYDSVYVTSTYERVEGLPEPDTLWYSRDHGIIGIDCGEDRYWIKQ